MTRKNVLKKIFDVSEVYIRLKKNLLKDKEIYTCGIIPSALPLLVKVIDEDTEGKLRFVILKKKEEFEDFIHLFNEEDLATIYSIEDLYKIFSKQKLYLISKELFGYLKGKRCDIPLKLKLNQTISKEELISKLNSLNYKSCVQVELTGEYATRGCIIDVFPFGSQLPLRIELDEYKILSLRNFSVEDQRSIRKITDFIIFPNLEDETSYKGDRLIIDELIALLADYLFILEEKEFFMISNILKNYRIWYLTSDYEGDFRFSCLGDFSLSEDIIKYYLKRWEKEGIRVVICSPDTVIRAKIEEFIKKLGFEEELFFLPFNLSSSLLEDKELRAAFISCNSIIKREKEGKPVHKRIRRRVCLSLLDLKEGDYVVHENHGIGIYRGIHKLCVDNTTRDYLLIEYANQDKLYLPPEYINLVEPYVGPHDELPQLSRLGDTSTWRRLKLRVKKEAEELAEQLIHTEALRKTIKGYSFKLSSNQLLKELEDTFPYEETEDQLQAIEEVYRDMEKDTCMERLICGDVGFGKTEVALRAAFKAILCGKQVAILAPTTVLAQQHFNTIKDRLEPFAVEVGIISRLQKEKEIRITKQRLKEGKIDLIIGTHKLLQEDIEFKELGLVIIDEEHRFGVKQKEHLRKLYPRVDLLYLSATPIPRTLYFALSGLRDISLIYTPPPIRQPIKTYIMPFSWDIVKSAIEKELLRGGQIFYLHNHIQSLPDVELKLRQLVPDIKIKKAFGSLDREELSSVMLDFRANKFSILVATSIIESGLDLPNVNTLIVSGAHKFGLAQLYQIRGRIGRRDKLAYAYLLYPPYLDKNKEKYKKSYMRLDLIKEFFSSSSGNSLRLALKDLQMRGCGELLGKKQHGNVKAVGLTLYSKLLKEAKNKILKEEEAKDEEFELPEIQPFFDAYIDESYLPQDLLRFQIYKRLNSIKSIEELNRFKEEIKDRFGELPEGLKKLLILGELRIMAAYAGVKKVYIEEYQDLLSCKIRKRVNILLKEKKGEKIQLPYVSEEDLIESLFRIFKYLGN